MKLFDVAWKVWGPNCIEKEGAKCQKINYEANNDRNLTKLTTHCLDLYQIEVWPFFRPQLPPHHGHNCPYILKVGRFSCSAKKITKIPGFPQPNFTKWLWFLAIFHWLYVYIPLWKIAKPQYFCTVWPFSRNGKSNPKVQSWMQNSTYWEILNSGNGKSNPKIAIVNAQFEILRNT